MKHHLACLYVNISGDHFECLILQDKFNVESKENYEWIYEEYL